MRTSRSMSEVRVQLRRCACGGVAGAHGECAHCKRRRLQRVGRGPGGGLAPPVVHDVTRSPGQPLERSVRRELEGKLGHDFSRVRVHTDARAARSAGAVDAAAYAVGSHVVFGEGRYEPGTLAGRQLLAHELVHTTQQPDGPVPARLAVGAPDDVQEREAQTAASTERPRKRAGSGEPVLRREPVFPDATCDSVRANIVRAWPTAERWVGLARRRLANPGAVASELRTHFRIDPNDAAQATDLAHVERVFARMEELLGLRLSNFCLAPNVEEECHLPDGREYAAFTHPGRPQDGITHCLASADVGLLGGEELIEAIVHEVAHMADSASRDYAYRGTSAITSYDRMTRAQAILNGDSYSEFARDLYAGPSTLAPVILGTGTGLLLSGRRPQWAITASYDIRSRSGIEVFDLVGGLHGFIGVAPADPTTPRLRIDTLGAVADVGFISRSADTRFFIDTRVGGFVSQTDLGGATPVGNVGLSANALIGWAKGGFRAGIDARLLFDFLHGNNAVIIGAEIGFTP